MHHMPPFTRQKSPIELYDTAYAGNAQRVYQEIRRETYDLDLGQTGWMMAEEFRGFWPLLHLTGLTCARIRLRRGRLRSLSCSHDAGGSNRNRHQRKRDQKCATARRNRGSGTAPV
jgi:hypothetical protein